jgi:hypothetical protein
MMLLALNVRPTVVRFNSYPSHLHLTLVKYILYPLSSGLASNCGTSAGIASSGTTQSSVVYNWSGTAPPTTREVLHSYRQVCRKKIGWPRLIKMYGGHYCNTSSSVRLIYDIKNVIQATILPMLSRILAIPGFKIIETSGDEIEWMNGWVNANIWYMFCAMWRRET